MAKGQKITQESNDALFKEFLSDFARIPPISMGG